MSRISPDTLSRCADAMSWPGVVLSAAPVALYPFLLMSEAGVAPGLSWTETVVPVMAFLGCGFMYLMLGFETLEKKARNGK